MTKQRIFALAAIMVIMLLVVVACSGAKDESAEEYQSPTKEELEAEIDFEAAEKSEQIYTADLGEILIPAAASASSDSERIRSADALWENDNGSASRFTLPESVALPDGSLGVLSISSINLRVAIYETDDEIESMAHGVAHLKSTSTWDGNVGLAGHNRGVNTYFGRIHELKVGDVITLKTSLGSRSYLVQTNKVIDENDWSTLGRTDDNRITLITCIDNQPTKRLCVQAVEQPAV